MIGNSDLSGVMFRIWGCFPFFAFGGVFVALNGFYGERRENAAKRVWITSICVGSAIFLFSVGYLFYYLDAMLNPQIVCIEGRLIESTRNSLVAPPLPVTTEYLFEGEGEQYRISLFLDSFSKRRIFSEELQEGNTYTVWYSEKGRIIVGVDSS